MEEVEAEEDTHYHRSSPGTPVGVGDKPLAVGEDKVEIQMVEVGMAVSILQPSQPTYANHLYTIFISPQSREIQENPWKHNKIHW